MSLSWLFLSFLCLIVNIRVNTALVLGLAEMGAAEVTIKQS